MMDKLASLLTSLLILGIFFWFQSNTNSITNMKLNPHWLTSQGPDDGRNLSERLRLRQVIEQTGSYTKSTSAVQRLYDLQYAGNIVNPLNGKLVYSEAEQQQVSAWPVADQSLCLQQLDWVLEQLRLHPKHLLEQGELAGQLSNLVDSFGKAPSGLLEGSLDWVGSYAQCMKVSMGQNGVKVNTRYCTAHVRPSWWTNKEIRYPPTGIHIAVCLPETCDTNSFNYSQQHRQQIELLVKHELPDLYKDGLQFESFFCLPDERSPIRQLPLSGRIYLFLVGIWLAFLAIASLVDRIYSKREANQRRSNKKLTELEQNCNQSTSPERLSRQICSAVSVRECFKELVTNKFTVDYKQGQRVRVDLRSLDFFKVIMTVLIIIAHSAIIVMSNAYKLGHRIELSASTYLALILSATHEVETFFVISGLLGAFTLLRKFKVAQLANPIVWLTINVNVFIRIAPIFALVYWYARSVSPYTGSGPSWDYGVDEHSMRGVCLRESWWRSIAYLANHGSPPQPMCAFPGWFLACYSHIWLLLPVITYTFLALPNHRSRFALASFLVVASVTSLSLTTYRQTLIPAEAFTIYGGFILNMVTAIGYSSTLGRLGSVVIGALAGYFLYLYQERKITSWPEWIRSKMGVRVAIGAHLLILLSHLLGKFAYQTTGRTASMELVVLLNTVNAIAWPLANAIAFIQMCTIHNHHLLVRFCSHPFWYSFNKLTFIMYLIHWEIEYVSVTAGEGGQIQGSTGATVTLGLYATAVSIIVSLFLYVLVEAPLSRLFAILMRAYARSPRLPKKSID